MAEENENEPIQQQTSKTTAPLKDKTLVRPQEDTTVYATQVLADAGLYKKGQSFIVHRVQADMLIKAGKAVAELSDMPKDGKPTADLGS